MSQRDTPPLSVITTSKTSSNHQTSDSVETPFVLIKPSKKDILSETNRVINVPSRPIDYAPTGSTAVVDRDSGEIQTHSLCELSPEESDKQIDSALLSALQDSRERLALLRLEKNLIDFMNDRTCGYMEVGGPGNSIVLRGASGGNGSSYTENDADNGPLKKNSGGNDYYAGGRQTSFQRLCLHRLADRFNIAREQVFHQNPNIYTNQNLGLIRLVKVKESRIPTVMLIDVDMSQYDNVTAQDRGDGLQPVGKVTHQLSGISLQEGNLTMKKSKKKENIKIMKRSSSSALTTGSEKSIKSKTNRRKSKNLSDKEKAYAEARARIFNSVSVDSSANNTPDPSEHADNVSTDGTPPGSANRSRAASPVQLKNESTGSSSTVEDPSSKPQAAFGHMSSNVDKSVTKRSILPAAVTAGAASKVTWRNREQEASDPDFRRGHHSIMMQVAPMQMQYQGYASHNGMGYPYGSVVDGQPYVPNYPPYYGSPASPMYHIDNYSQRQSYPSNNSQSQSIPEQNAVMQVEITSRHLPSLKTLIFRQKNSQP
jgi:hypothetical protein